MSSALARENTGGRVRVRVRTEAGGSGTPATRRAAATDTSRFGLAVAAALLVAEMLTCLGTPAPSEACTIHFRRGKLNHTRTQVSWGQTCRLVCGNESHVDNGSIWWQTPDGGYIYRNGTSIQVHFNDTKKSGLYVCFQTSPWLRALYTAISINGTSPSHIAYANDSGPPQLLFPWSADPGSWLSLAWYIRDNIRCSSFQDYVTKLEDDVKKVAS